MNCIECHKQVKKAIPVWKGKKGKEIVYVCLDCFGPTRNVSGWMGKRQQQGIFWPRGMQWNHSFMPPGMRVARYKELREAGFPPHWASRIRDLEPSKYDFYLKRGSAPYLKNPLGVDLLAGIGLGGGWLIGQQAVEKASKFLGIKKSSNPLYEDFHGATPKTRVVDLPVPAQNDKLLAIGFLESLVYRPYGSSSLKGRLFEHKLGDDGNKIHKTKPILATDSKGRHLYIIPDKAKTKFTSRGIIK
jgi:hypothetical protein